MLIGGAEDKLKKRVILTRFLSLSGGADSHIAVISTASSLGDAATEFYRELFTQMGAGTVSGLRPVTREEANQEALVEVIDQATGVFLTGGNQLRLASVVGGTRLGAALLEAHQRGVVIAGTSAGASAVSTHMVAFGAAGASPKHRMVQISAGLGLLKGVVVDQHFEQRTRLGRLLTVVAQSPALIGLGLDEDTAAIIHSDETLEVIGRGSVTVIDGSVAQTDSYQTIGHKPMMVSGVVLHSIPSGYLFDLKSRSLVPSVGVPSPREAQMAEAARRQMERLARQIASERTASSHTENRKDKPSQSLPEASE
jgi:cyanophycinase